MGVGRVAVLASLAKLEREKIKLRTMMGRRFKASTGRVVGANQPTYGLRFTTEVLANGEERTVNYEPDPLTGPIAREALLGLLRQSAGKQVDETQAHRDEAA